MPSQCLQRYEGHKHPATVASHKTLNTDDLPKLDGVYGKNPSNNEEGDAIGGYLKENRHRNLWCR